MLSGQGTGEVLSPSGICPLLNESPLQAIRALELNELKRVESELRHLASTDSTVVHPVVIIRSHHLLHISIIHPKRASADIDPTDSTTQEAMVESGSQSLRLPLGEDLVAGHVHARQPSDTAGFDASPRIKKRGSEARQVSRR